MEKNQPGFPIAGIGASAGGLAALESLVGAIASSSGFCYVVIQHLAPDHPSIMAELLSAHSAIKVQQIKDGDRARPNTIFVMPAGPSVTIKDGIFRLQERSKKPGRRTPINRFLASLAEQSGHNAYCVILSGTGSDGTEGLRTIKAAGGYAIVQESHSAQFAGMPDSAAATGLADYVLAAEQIPQSLVAIYQRKLPQSQAPKPHRHTIEIEEALPDLLALLTEADAEDFRQYKPGTLVRRIERRMALNGTRSVSDFMRLLAGSEAERSGLRQDFLIGVTRFFRDSVAFERLSQHVIRPMLNSRQQGFRIWVPGCSTGEEVYTIAMLIAEAMEQAEDCRAYQIFGTDIDQAALMHARKGTYPARAIEGVSDLRRERFFVKAGNDFQLTQRIRRSCVFTPHNLLQDPPFSQLDLISCRNLFIYFGTAIQRELIARFHFGLNPRGFLLLGPSETLGIQDNFFNTIERNIRLFQRNDATPVRFSSLAVHENNRIAETAHRRRQMAPAHQNNSATQPMSLEAQADHYFLHEFAAPYAIVNHKNEVTYLSEGMARFVRPIKGEPSNSIDRFLMRELRQPVRSAIAGALKSGQRQTEKNVLVPDAGERTLFDIVAAPLPTDTDSVIVVLQAVRTQDANQLSSVAHGGSGTDLQTLKRELALTSKQLISLRRAYDSAEQELRSSNEELLSMNEEMQSANQELETSREELQSINEELETVNAELSENNSQLAQTNSDLQNLLDSTDIATLFLDRALCLRRFTPGAKALFGVLDRDLGRPLSDLSSRLEYRELDEDFNTVLRTHQPIEKEVTIPASDETFVLRIRPYRTLDDQIDGCVLSFFDITQRKRAERQLESSAQVLATQYAELESLYDTMPVGLCLMDTKLRWLRINERMAEMNGFTPEEHLGKTISELLPDISSKVIAVYERVLETKEAVLNIEISGRTPARPNRNRDWLVDYVPIFSGDKIIAIGTCVREITEQKQLQHDLQDSQRTLMLALEAGRLGVFTADLETGQIDRSPFSGNWFRPGFLFDSWTLDDLMNLVDEADREPLQKAFDRAISTHEPQSLVLGFNRVSGKPRRLQLFTIVHERDDGKQQLTGLGMDVTDREQELERSDMLLRELQHRVKNTLTVIIALLRFSAKGAESVASLTAALTDRLLAMARTHDVLIKNEWHGDSLRDLIERELTPFTIESKPRWSIAGQDAYLSPKQALALGLAIHELATNAVKYGALSVEEGEIKVSVQRPEGSQTVEISWAEAKGPNPLPATRRASGFGTFLIEKVLATDLGGKSTLAFGPSGLTCTITFQLQNAGSHILPAQRPD